MANIKYPNMIPLVKLIGIFMASMGITVILNPNVMKKMISYWRQGKRIYIGGLLRAVFGTIFLLSVLQARLPEVIYVLGILFLITALIIFIMGLEKAKAVLGWWDKRPLFILRIMSILVLAIGALVIYSA